MKLEKILKKLPEAVVQEMDTLVAVGLNAVIAQAEEAMASAIRDRDANPKYQSAKQACKDLSEGLKDTKNYQTAKIHYALHLLREKL